MFFEMKRKGLSKTEIRILILIIAFVVIICAFFWGIEFAREGKEKEMLFGNSIVLETGE